MTPSLTAARRRIAKLEAEGNLVPGDGQTMAVFSLPFMTYDRIAGFLTLLLTISSKGTVQ
jgi:hypothetical protein